MRLIKFFKNQKLIGAAQPAMAANLNHSEGDFKLPPDEVAKRAYFNYVNQGLQPEHDLQHWLELAGGQGAIARGTQQYPDHRFHKLDTK